MYRVHFETTKEISEIRFVLKKAAEKSEDEAKYWLSRGRTDLFKECVEEELMYRRLYDTMLDIEYIPSKK